MDTELKQKNTRIPLALQAVFLASNRGNEVHQPPPDNSASKVFSKNWLFQRRGQGQAKEQKMYPRVLSVKTLSFGYGKSSKSVTGGDGTAPEKVGQDMRSISSRALGLSKHSISTLSIDSTHSVNSFEKETPRVSPQAYLDGLFRSRGLSSESFKTLQSGYRNLPTTLQASSYGPRLIELVRDGDIEALEKMLQAGISPNPCSATGESLIHLICRRGESKMLKLFLDYGASIQVSDSLGRTPLHEACWAKPCFKTIELILKADASLFNMADGQGAVPLSYVRKGYWRQWINFLEAKQNVFLPHVALEPPLTMVKPHSLPLADPLCALSPKQAAMVVSGQIAPENALTVADDEDNGDEDSFSDDESSQSFASEYDKSHQNDTCWTTDTFDVNEMENLLLQLSEQRPCLY